MMNSKISEDFKNWLISSQNLQKRSAGDIISRRNKLLSIIADPSSLQINQIKLELENNFIKGEFTRPTLSGMIRSEIFFRKFQKSYLI